MLVQCSWCQKNFNSDRYGRQLCPHCGAELELEPPAAAPAAPPASTEPRGAAPQASDAAGQRQEFDPWAQPGEPNAWPGAAPGRGGPQQPQQQPWNPQGSGAQPQQPWGQPGGQPQQQPWNPQGSGAQPQQPWGQPGGQPQQQPWNPQGPAAQPQQPWSPQGWQAQAPGWGASAAGTGLPPPGTGGGNLPPGGGWGAPPPVEHDQPAPWERRGELGLWKAFVETWKQASLDSKRFFSGLRRTGIGEPFLWGWILSTIGMVLSGAWSIPMVAFTGGDPAEAWFQIVGGPFFSAIGLFLQAGILHLVCLLLGIGSKGFDATFRAVAYAQGPMILAVIPGIGGIAASIWAAIITIQGIAAMQETTTGKATLAVVLPGLLAIVCCCGALMVGISAIAGSGADFSSF